MKAAPSGFVLLWGLKPTEAEELVWSSLMPPQPPRRTTPPHPAPGRHGRRRGAPAGPGVRVHLVKLMRWSHDSAASVLSLTLYCWQRSTNPLLRLKIFSSAFDASETYSAPRDLAGVHPSRAIRSPSFSDPAYQNLRSLTRGRGLPAASWSVEPPDDDVAGNQWTGDTHRARTPRIFIVL